MKNLRADAEKETLFHILLVSLVAVLVVSLPLEKLTALIFSNNKTANLVAFMFLRVVVTVFAFILIKKYKFTNTLKSSVTLKSLVMVLPALLVAVNNFSIIGFITGEVEINVKTLNIVLYVFAVLSVGFFEETVFRGIVFPLFLMKFKSKKYSVFLSVLCSSLIFALLHLINLFTGNIGGTFLQVGYTFLIGGMCAIALIITKNIFVSIVIHAVYDIGGLLNNSQIGIAVGNQWDTVTIIITAVLGVIVFVYMTYMLFWFNKNKKSEIYSLFNIDLNEEQEK